jgi:hypothetical protein
LAKLAEYFDVKIYRLTSGTISGHTLKHILAATGLYKLIHYLQKKKEHSEELIILTNSQTINLKQ